MLLNRRAPLSNPPQDLMMTNPDASVPPTIEGTTNLDNTANPTNHVNPINPTIPPRLERNSVRDRQTNYW
uniref:Uncharacterized protein n=1 Tax=Cannabis sativa TaxID=3483 RepID=A0A803QGX0_CANSA